VPPSIDRSGNSGHADPESNCQRAAAWLGHCPSESSLSPTTFLQVGQGSLYPALHRLEYKGWIRAEWGASENNRKARFYSLTAAGRKQLKCRVGQLDPPFGCGEPGAAGNLRRLRC